MKTLGFEPPISELTLNDGWTVHTVDTIDSTNSAAGSLPSWHALRARGQTAGRGRTGRSWVSDVGGVWLSAVLPCDAGDSRWRFLPLAVGWSLVTALRALGVPNIRLRWPNDLMVDQRKLAGLLMERFTADKVVVGLGLNVFNSPGMSAPELVALTTRLADLVEDPGSLEEVTRWALQAIRRAHQRLVTEGFCSIVTELNDSWPEPILVELTLSGGTTPVRGHFVGIDEQGHLRLSLGATGIFSFDANQVALLREIE